MIQDYLAGKNILIMGLGRFGGGVDATRFAHVCGAKVTVTDLLPAEKLTKSLGDLKDLNGITYRLGEHLEADFQKADTVIFNPAVDPDNEFLKIAKEHGAEVTTSMNIFFNFCPAKIIGVTGANGKSTTTSLTSHILEVGSVKEDVPYDQVFLSGNIGNKPLLQCLFDIQKEDLVVLEISSFQSELMEDIKKGPFTAVLTNLTPNHLDRHGTFEEYCRAKEVLFKYQPDNPNEPAISIFNAEDEVSVEWYEKYHKKEGRKCLLYSPETVSGKIANNFKLPGRANLSNLAAATTIAKEFGVSDETISEAVKNFQPLPHRLQLIGEKNGVKFYNDSISTTPDSTLAALNAFDQHVILIAGGYDKQLTFEKLGKLIAEKAKGVALIGETTNKIYNEIIRNDTNIKISLCNSLEEATKRSYEMATPGDVVVLSPACASYDMFENFQQRGKMFCELVRSL